MNVGSDAVAVVGGGINGICIAWEFARHGRRVDLFEAHTLMSQTSSASSKLLHGGLRYLEYGRVFSVREALLERAWWLQHAPSLTNRVELLLPVYRGLSRSGFEIRLGLTVYDWLAGGRGIGRHRSWSVEEIRRSCPGLKSAGLKGGYSFFDGQMDDRRLGLWAAEQARNEGAVLHEQTPVDRVSIQGEVWLKNGESRRFSRVVNATGPWASSLMEQSAVHSAYGVEAIRGSHLLIDRLESVGYCLQHPDDGRVFFVLPYSGKTLIGTTEVYQHIDEPIAPSSEELNYLLHGYNHYFVEAIDEHDIVDTFAGLRPIVRSEADPTRASREYVIESLGALINVWGGKWTTSRALARKVYKKANRG